MTANKHIKDIIWKKQKKIQQMLTHLTPTCEKQFLSTKLQNDNKTMQSFEHLQRKL